eukprot:scaffold5479_cov199-Amphora_coffeaeformis.AAC.105
MFRRKVSIFLLLTLPLAKAFVHHYHHDANARRGTFGSSSSSVSTTTSLGMGKSINKQAELRKKMELAKKKQQQPTDNVDESKQQQQQQLSDKEMKEQNYRKRFEELLQQSKASAVWNDYASTADDYKNQEQIEEEIEAQRKGVERLFEGDPAPEGTCWEGLVIPQTDAPLGKVGMERLVPWLGKTANDDDYLLVICDPRPDSPDLQTTAQQLWSDLKPDLRQRLVIINADSPAQNRKWFKKNGWSTTGPTVYSDTQREWMTAHTALGDKRWSMTLFVLASGRVQKLVRDLDVYTASKVVPKAVAAFKDAKL